MKRMSYKNSILKFFCLILSVVGLSAVVLGGFSNTVNAVGGSVAISGLSATYGSTAGGSTITITGTNFWSAQNTPAVIAVRFGNTSALDFTVVNDTTINAVVPPNAIGATDVSLVTTSGGIVTLSGSYTYYLIDVANISPERGHVVGGQAVEIVGKNFKVNFIGVATGSKHSVAIDATGNLYVWGSDDQGQIGDGDENSDSVLYPKKINGYGDIAEDTKIVAVSAGYSHSLAIDSDGNLYAWGENTYGQIGGGSNTAGDAAITAPMKINGKGELAANAKITKVSGGLRHTLAVDADGNLYAWGYNRYGQIGNNTSSVTDFEYSPVIVGSDMVDVAAGHRHSMALDASGNVYTWGTNYQGQIGDGSSGSNQLTPWKVNGGGGGILADTRIVEIAGGYIHSTAIDSDGNLYAWGGNHYGQIGDGNIGTESSGLVKFPWKVNGGGGDILASTRIVAVACGSNHTLAVDAGGDVYSWGRNTDGQIGNGVADDNHILLPWKANGSGELSADAMGVSVAGGSGHTMAIDSDGNLYTWGRDEMGQIGNGHSVGEKIPAPWKFGKTDFNAITGIAFGGVSALSFVVNSDTSATVITPEHVSGVFDVDFTTLGEQKVSYSVERQGGYEFYDDVPGVPNTGAGVGSEDFAGPVVFPVVAVVLVAGVGICAVAAKRKISEE